MRILALTTSYPRWSRDTAGVFIHAMLREGVRRFGWEATVLAPHAPGLARREVLDGVDVRRFLYAWPEGLERLCYDGGIPAALRARPWTGVLVGPLLGAFTMAARRLAHEADIIHAHWTVIGLVGLWAKARPGQPMVVTSHGSDLSLAGGSRALRAVNRRVLARADVLAIVGSRQRALAEALGCPADRIESIPYGVQDCPSSQGPLGAPLPDRRFDVVFVGRLTDEKRPGLLIEALAALARAGKPLRACIVGDGPLAEALREQVQREGLGAKVELAGAVPHERVMELMRASRCLVLVSQREGLPNVIREAMSCGLPVVATDVGSVSDVVHHEQTGLLLGADPSVAEVAASIEAVLDRPDRSAGMASAARELIMKEYTLTGCVERHDRLYRQLLAGPKDRQGDEGAPA